MITNVRRVSYTFAKEMASLYGVHDLEKFLSQIPDKGDCIGIRDVETEIFAADADGTPTLSARTFKNAIGIVYSNGVAVAAPTYVSGSSQSQSSYQYRVLFVRNANARKITHQTANDFSRLSDPINLPDGYWNYDLFEQGRSVKKMIIPKKYRRS